MALRIAPEAQTLYDDTIRRAAGTYIFGYQWTSSADSRRVIDDVLYAAASLTEVCEGQALDEDRYLDLTEVRLAAATLNLVTCGENLVSVGEAEEAYRLLGETMGEMYRAPIFGSSYAERLMSDSAGRARGWRRIRASSVEGQIRALYRSSANQVLDPREGMNPADALLVAMSLNMYAGGVTESIRMQEIWSASAGLEIALRNL